MGEGTWTGTPAWTRAHVSSSAGDRGLTEAGNNMGTSRRHWKPAGRPSVPDKQLKQFRVSGWMDDFAIIHPLARGFREKPMTPGKLTEQSHAQLCSSRGRPESSDPTTLRYYLLEPLLSISFPSSIIT